MNTLAALGGVAAPRKRPEPATPQEAMMRRMEADLGQALGRPASMIEREQQAQRRMQQHQMQMQAQQQRMRSTEGLVMRRRNIHMPMVLVPPEPTPDKFQAYMLGVISKVKKMHKEVFGVAPETIELGEFLMGRLKPWMEERPVEMFVPVKTVPRTFSDGHQTNELICETVTENRHFLKGMIVEKHPDETWIDVP